MDHFKSEWDIEMTEIRKTVHSNEGIAFSNHVTKERMSEREVNMIDIAYSFMTGQIYEGYDIGQYPKYRNPDPLRTIVGKDSNGEYLTVGVALKSDGTFRVTTVYRGVTDRLKHFFE